MTTGTEQELIPVLADSGFPENGFSACGRRRPGRVPGRGGELSPSTRRAYVTGWKDFTGWCLEHRCSGLPSLAGRRRPLSGAPGGDGRQDAGHRLGGHPDPTPGQLVKATLKRVAREHGKPRKQAKRLTSEPWPRSRRRRGSSGPTRAGASARESEAQAARRARWTWSSCR